MISLPEIPAPVPPDASDAWHAPDVHSQYEPTRGVVVTIGGKRYTAYSVYGREFDG